MNKKLIKIYFFKFIASNIKSPNYSLIRNKYVPYYALNARIILKM